ncbi:DUF1990 domain-containing protein [Micromonospora sp. NBC_01412]
MFLELPWIAIRIGAPCRVVYTINERGESGFAYGTLSGHPESGEEAFIVTRDRHDRVWFSIKAFSRPASLYVHLAEPFP